MNENLQTRIEPGQDRSRATMQSIMDASASLIADFGFDAVSMTQIAKQAGMSKAALYRYFPNKQSLLMAHAERSFKVHREEMQSVMQNSIEPEEMLRAGINHYCLQHANNPFLLNLRAAIHADPVLSELDLKDSRENAALLGEFLSEHFPSLDPVTIETRSLLTMELIDSLARLIARVSPPEQKRMVDEFVHLFFSDITSQQSS
ncbi:MAG: TetR/AcrR family transcriptional regulator [Pseudomonadota bacterium]